MIMWICIHRYTTVCISAVGYKVKSEDLFCFRNILQIMEDWPFDTSSSFPFLALVQKWIPSPALPSGESGKPSTHMAGPGEHTDVLNVVPASQTPSFTQLRSLNPCLAALFSGRLLLNGPPPHKNHITLTQPVEISLLWTNSWSGGKKLSKVKGENKQSKLRSNMFGLNKWMKVNLHVHTLGGIL